MIWYKYNKRRILIEWRRWSEYFVHGADNKASSRGIGSSFRESESLPRNVPGNYQENGATTLLSASLEIITQLHEKDTSRINSVHVIISICIKQMYMCMCRNRYKNTKTHHKHTFMVWT